MRPRPPQDKIRSLETTLAWRRQLDADGFSLVVTNGCFDLIHRGHVEYLNRARTRGDALLVAINSDVSVRAVKGPDRPVVPEVDRAYLLASLESVDAVYVFDAPTATDFLGAVKPDVYVKGGDYTRDTIVGEERELLTRMGCRIEFLPHVAGMSTTELIRRIRG